MVALQDRVMPLTHADDESKKSVLNEIFKNQPIRMMYKSPTCYDAAGMQSLTSPKHHVSSCLGDT